jgi:hypothetical protein
VTSTIPSTSVVVVADAVFSEAEQLALAGFLAGYRGVTRDAYALDLRQFVAWCDQHDLRLYEVPRADIECFARDVEVFVFESAPSLLVLHGWHSDRFGRVGPQTTVHLDSRGNESVCFLERSTPTRGRQARERGH